MKFEIKCKHCGRFLAHATKSTVIELKCSNSRCKKLDTYRITFMSDLVANGHHSVLTDKIEVEPNKQSS